MSGNTSDKCSARPNPTNSNIARMYIVSMILMRKAQIVHIDTSLNEHYQVVSDCTTAQFRRN